MTSTLKAFSVAAALALSFCLNASAQFYSNGEDPAGIRWFSVKTRSYNVIYPEGLDSLARVYGNTLEKYRLAESASSGLTPGEGYGRRTPVILHAYHGVANGVVTWAPRRMDLYTLPEMYNPVPMPNEKSLSIHEGRHMAQMQFGYKGWLRPLTYVLGDMAVGGYSAIWPSDWFLEGDAVVAETALTSSGRGRSADFLEYYKAAFDSGDWRNWYKWRYGSYRHYAPDHYALGYMTIGGARYCFDDPLFTERYFSRIASNPFRFFNTKKTLKQASGMNLKDSFSSITEAFHKDWEDSDAAREPFTKTERIQPEGSWYREMNGGIWCNGRMYSVCSGIADPSNLVEYDPETGKIRNIRAFASYTGRLRSSGDRLWWSESVYDRRWSLAMTSRIRYYDTVSGKTGSLTEKGRYFNPAPSEDGKLVAAVSIPVKGGSEIVLLDSGNGRVIGRRTMPDSLQAYEVCFTEEGLAVCTISDGGSGIFILRGGLDGDLECLSGPLPVSIRNISGEGRNIFFTSDRDGTQELYSMDPDSGTISQLTSLKYGGDNFCRHGGSWYFTELSRSGKLLHRISAEDIEKKAVDFSDIHKYKIADKLTEQEKLTTGKKGIEWPEDSSVSETELSSPKRYRKVPHIFRFHSWAPVYFNYDNISQISGDYFYETASAGATALFQNSLGTAWGTVGYSFHRDPNRDAYSRAGKEAHHKYRHSGHFTFTYAGLYPVFELSADFNDRAATQYYRRSVRNSDGGRTEKVYGSILSTPYLSGELKAYIPFNFSSGGWQRGLVPQFQYFISNDLFDKSAVNVNYSGNFSGTGGISHFEGYSEGDNVFLQRARASLRGYILRPVASSGIYPRAGIGAEAGYTSRITLDKLYSSSAYSYVYGYIPGFTPTQGLKLTGKFQHRFEAEITNENSIEMAPRGFSGSDAEYFISNCYSDQVKLTADYAIPVWFGDISCFSPFFYIKNFELTPHFDYTFCPGKGIESGSLYSLGATVAAHLANLIWIPYDCTVGFTFDLNGGRSMNAMKRYGCAADKFHIGFVFNISL